MHIDDQPLLFAGEGHGGVATLKGLIERGFQPDVCSDDEEVVSLAVAAGGSRVRSFKEWPHFGPGLILMAAYRPLIDRDTLSKGRFINIHYALLPRYRGLHATVWAVLNGETHVGFTLHEVDDLVDSGAVIWQEQVQTSGKTSWQLMLELDETVRIGVGDAVRQYMTGLRTAVAQNDDDAIFVTRRNLEDCRVDWLWSAEYFERVLMALVSPYPLPFFDYKGHRVEISKAQVVHRYYREIPGHVVYRDRESVWIKLSDGLLRVWEFTIGGERVSALDFFKVTGARLWGRPVP